MTDSPAIAAYIRQIAIKIRAKEANLLRGKPEALSSLEALPDVDLVTRWAWTSAIVGAITVFAIGVALNLFYSLLPGFIYGILWLLLKLAVVAVALMFGAALWLTFKPPANV